jgi:hypothetical protein
MDNRDIQLEKLFGNYEELEDTNKDKLLLVSKKLLGIKTLIRSEDKSKVKDENTGKLNDKNTN